MHMLPCPQANPNFYTSLETDVRGEVGKVGSVLHVACDKWSNGFVYVKMFTAHDAQRLKDVSSPHPHTPAVPHPHAPTPLPSPHPIPPRALCRPCP